VSFLRCSGVVCFENTVVYLLQVFLSNLQFDLKLVVDFHLSPARPQPFQACSSQLLDEKSMASRISRTKALFKAFPSA